MGTLATDQTAIPHVESVLRDELVRADNALGGVAPVLSHLLASPGLPLVSDATLARLRGTLSDIASQVLTVAEDKTSGAPLDTEEVDRFTDHLGADSALLSHLYAAAMEAEFTTRLEQRASIDPVLSPLLQELIASDDPAVAELAMSAMAAQSRFVQSQRRMQLSIGELPAELYHKVIKRSVAYVRERGGTGSPSAVQAMKRGFDEGKNRVGLFSRLVASMGNGVRAALELDHAGFALFASGIGAATRQPRELAILSCHERQGARLALALRAAGLDAAAVEQQFRLIDSSESLPIGLNEIAPERAQTLLNRSPVRKSG
ncbi:MAG: hypothetical protein AAF687_08085 [Pseudomonadota bacterium]